MSSCLLYVSFICSWRALRVQKSVSSEEPVLHANDVALLPSSSLSASKNDWQQDLWTFDAREDDDGGNSEDIDIEDLSRAFSEAINLTSDSKKQNCDADHTLKPSITDQKSKADDKRFPGIVACVVLESTLDVVLHAAYCLEVYLRMCICIGLPYLNTCISQK